ncbi:hypothetical protein [Chitinophaga varians]|uniref:hypothetical protein n=1 Tax=Chitinophaga varians TaxID=2202339 RepID=UPI00165F8714|nr:hypothetical protein [Chitinophaga varians]MBC9911293.1 hypothetical protein [Chitinophaga varians]
MKRLIISILLVPINIVLFFLLQVPSAFIAFGIFGSGGDHHSDYAWLHLPFVCLQVGFNIWLYIKKKLPLSVYILMINIAITIALYIYLIVLDRF